MVEGTGASDVVAQEGLKFALERFAFDDFAVARLELSDGGSKDFGDVGSAEATIEAVGSDAVGGRGSKHGGKFFRELMAWSNRCALLFLSRESCGEIVGFHP